MGLDNFENKKSNEEIKPLTLEQRKGLRGVILGVAGGLTLTALMNDGSEQGDVEAVPKPAFVEVEDNEHNKQLREAIENETEESRMERMSMDSCLEQTGSLDKCLDELNKEVVSFAEALSESDIQETAELASQIEFDTSSFETRSVQDDDRGRPAVPDFIQERLRNVVIGWVAQESRFKKDAISTSGAESYGQFKPYVWEAYRGTKEVSRDLNENLETMGNLASDNYHFIIHYAGEDSIAVLKGQFGSEQDFMEKFMALVVLGSHNSGGPTEGKALKKFVEQVSQEDMKEGNELYAQYRDFAYQYQEGYGVEQAQYVARVLAFNSVLKDRLSTMNGDMSHTAMNDSGS